MAIIVKDARGSLLILRQSKTSKCNGILYNMEYGADYVKG